MGYRMAVVICLERGADCLHMVQLMPMPYPNPIISAFLCFLLCMFLLYITVLLPVGVIKDDLNPDCFYLSGTGLPSLSWKRVR